MFSFTGSETSASDHRNGQHARQIEPLSPRKRIIVAMTGATGSILGIKTLLALRHLNVETHLILSKWAEANDAVGGNPNVGKYLGIYAAFGIGSAFLVVLQTLTLWIFCSIEVCSHCP